MLATNLLKKVNVTMEVETNSWVDEPLGYQLSSSPNHLLASRHLATCHNLFLSPFSFVGSAT